MSIYTLIAERQSVRAYAPQTVEREKLERILRAGAAAPTARNEQLQHTIAVTDPELIKQLAPNQPFVANAPVVLVIYAENERVMACGHSARTVDCSIALSYMVLAAKEEGLQGCWLGGFDGAIPHKLLGLPEGASIVAMHTLGYPAGDTPRRPKKPAEEMYTII